MVIHLDAHYCHRCQCSHPFGKHRGTPSPKLPAHLAQTPIAAALHSYNGHAPKPKIQAPSSYLPFKPQSRLDIKPRKRGHGPFDKTTYQKLLMKDRREADIAGFGGSKDPNSPKYNPQYKTVGQFRLWRALQEREKGR